MTSRRYRPSYGPDEVSVAFGLWRHHPMVSEASFHDALRACAPGVQEAFDQAGWILAGRSSSTTPTAARRAQHR
jgi:hypothetical protein